LELNVDAINKELAALIYQKTWRTLPLNNANNVYINQLQDGTPSKLRLEYV